MPILFSVGQHAALEATQRRLRRDERLFAFLDDIYLVCKPERFGEVHSVLERELWGQRSESILARPMCGTDQDICLPFVTSCRGEQFSKIPRRRCGRGQVSRLTGRASKSWDVHWDMRIS